MRLTQVKAINIFEVTDATKLFILFEVSFSYEEKFFLDETEEEEEEERE